MVANDLPFRQVFLPAASTYVPAPGTYHGGYGLAIRRASPLHEVGLDVFLDFFYAPPSCRSKAP